MSIRIGVVGLGIGQQHLRFLSQMPQVEIGGVCDLDGTTTERMAQRYNTVPYTSLASMLEQAELHALTICTPPALHAEMTELAARHRVHVLCEKPMAGSLADCQRMIDAAQRHGIKLMIALKKRFAPYYTLIKRMCDEAGHPPLWASVRYALGRVDKDWFWQEGNGGGPLLENAVHLVDALRFLMGEIRRVSAEGGTLFMRERYPVPDAAAVTFRFVSGAVASLGLGYGCEWSLAREELLLASEDYVFELQGPFDQANTLRYVKRRQSREVHTISLAGNEYTGGFVEEFEHFVDCVEHDKPPRAGGEDGLKAVQICLAIKQAVQTGRPVDVSDNSEQG